MPDDVQCVGELTIAHRRPGLEHAFQRHKKLFGALDGVGGAFQLYPAVARGDLDTQFGFERLQVPRLVVEKLLGDARVFEMEGFRGHYKFNQLRSRAFKTMASLPASRPTIFTTRFSSTVASCALIPDGT